MSSSSSFHSFITTYSPEAENKHSPTVCILIPKSPPKKHSPILSIPKIMPPKENNPVKKKRKLTYVGPKPEAESIIEKHDDEEVVLIENTEPLKLLRIIQQLKPLLIESNQNKENTYKIKVLVDFLTGLKGGKSGYKGGENALINKCLIIMYQSSTIDINVRDSTNSVDANKGYCPHPEWYTSVAVHERNNPERNNPENSEVVIKKEKKKGKQW